MIYIVATNDTSVRNSTITKYAQSRDCITIDSRECTVALLRDYASSSDLFGASPIIVIDGFIKEGNETLNTKDLALLKDSPTVFIFCEETLTAANQKKYSAYADITVKVDKKPVVAPKVNVFAIADAYGRKDKITTWVLYRDAVTSGLEPEAIAGMLFWKIKTLIIQGNKTFGIENLKKHSGKLVKLYHDAHLGKKDFVVGLEQFILTTLS